jgi:hypothetical protein
MAAAMKDQQQPADIPAVTAAPAPAAPAAAPAQQQQISSSSSVSQGVHKPKFSSTCKFFAQGTCKFGSSCAFVHLMATAGTAATAASAPAGAPDSSAWYDSGVAAPAGGSYNQQHSVPLQQQQQPQQLQQQAAPAAGQMPSYLGPVPHAMPGFEQQQATPDVSYVQQQPHMPYQQEEHYGEQQYGQQRYGQPQQEHGQQQYSQQQYSQQQYSQQQYSQQQYSQQQPPYQPPLQQQQPSSYASYPQSIPPAGPYDPYSY